jgi:phage-related tail protein
MTDELEARIRVIEEEVARLGGLLNETRMALEVAMNAMKILTQQIATHDAVIAQVETVAINARTAADEAQRAADDARRMVEARFA